MLTIYSDDHRLQDGRAELIGGQLLPCFEMPRRADMILARVRAVGLGAVEPPAEQGILPIARVHDAGFLAFLQQAWADWSSTGRDHDALPLCWPSRTLRQRPPRSIDGRLSYYSFDAGTPITAGSWRAAYASAQVALTGAARVADGARAAFALCRPPGHHAARDLYGGYCFLNNAAIAAQSLRDRGAARVAVLDVDYHHGNGSQAIFYQRGDVLTVSLHCDPDEEFPFFLGFADETGEGAGEGTNLNLPMPRGTGFGRWAEALEVGMAAVRRFGAEALVVSLGVDTFEQDPISHFRLQSPDFTSYGRRIAGLGLPTLFVMEGGYAVEAIGVNTVNVLTGFEEAG